MFEGVRNITTVIGCRTKSGSIYLIAQTEAKNYYLHTLNAAKQHWANGAIELRDLPKEGEHLVMYRGKRDLQTSVLEEVIPYANPDRLICGHLRASACTCRHEANHDTARPTRPRSWWRRATV